MRKSEPKLFTKQKGGSRDLETGKGVPRVLKNGKGGSRVLKRGH